MWMRRRHCVGYTGAIRQGAVDGWDHPHPTLCISNNFDASARDLITRYVGRNGVEDSLGISINVFHLDCLASEVRLNVDVDVALTALAHGCYRWLATQLHGFDKAKPKQLYRKFVETRDRSKCRPIGLWCILTNGPTIRSCAKLPLIRRAPLCPGCTISPSLLRTHNLRQGRWKSVSHFLAAKIGDEYIRVSRDMCDLVHKRTIAHMHVCTNAQAEWWCKQHPQSSWQKSRPCLQTERSFLSRRRKCFCLKFARCCCVVCKIIVGLFPPPVI
jgi:hypothetical protein